MSTNGKRWKKLLKRMEYGDVEWRGWMRRIIGRRTMSTAFSAEKLERQKHWVKNWGSTMLVEKRREYVCLPVQLCSGGGRRERESEWEKRKKRKLKRAEKQWPDQNITCFWFNSSNGRDIMKYNALQKMYVAYSHKLRHTWVNLYLFLCWLDKVSILKSYLSFFFFIIIIFFFFFWD